MTATELLPDSCIPIDGYCWRGCEARLLGQYIIIWAARAANGQLLRGMARTIGEGKARAERALGQVLTERNAGRNL